MKYFKNTSWLFGEKILRMIVGLFLGIFTTFTILGFDGKVVRKLFIKNIRKNYIKMKEIIGI